MAKKIPLPKVKAKKMHWLDKLYMGIGGLSPFTGRAALHRSMSGATPSGQAANAAQMARLAKYGKWGSRAARWSGLMNPWSAIPLALGYGAKHAVGSALEGYKNQDVEDTGMFFDNRGISEAGNERLLQERLAREELLFARNAARQNQNEGGIARLL
jgi:hypothetical protein